MTTIKVKFRPSSVVGRAGTVVYQLIHRRKVRIVSTGIRVLPGDWDVEKDTLSDRRMVSMRRQILSGEERLRDIVRSLEREGKSYTVDHIVQRFHAKDKEFSFFDFMRKEIRFLTKNGKFSTAHNYRSALNSLSSFWGKDELPFSALTARLVEEYGVWLSGRGISRNTLSFYMRVLRAVYNKAVREGLIKQAYPFRNVYTGVDRTRKRAVAESTVSRLSGLKIPSSSLAMVRDLFIFSYCTRGMAFVDIVRLRKRDIQGGTIHYVRSKTKQPLAVRLEDITKKIIERYSSNTKDASAYLFPILTAENPETSYRQYQTALRRYNRQLARLSAMLDDGTRLSSYTARHSWATVARDHDIPLYVISAGMGHTSEKTTRIYLSTLENTVIDDANRKIVERLKTSVSTQETAITSQR